MLSGFFKGSLADLSCPVFVAVYSLSQLTYVLPSQLSERWFENYSAFLEDGPFGKFSPYIRSISGIMVSKVVQLQLYLQGTGRHSREELRQLREEAIENLGSYATSACTEGHHTGDSEEPFWILGDTAPTEADFSLYGYLATILASRP